MRESGELLELSHWDPESQMHAPLHCQKNLSNEVGKPSIHHDEIHQGQTNEPIKNPSCMVHPSLIFLQYGRRLCEKFPLSEHTNMDDVLHMLDPHEPVP